MRRNKEVYKRKVNTSGVTTRSRKKLLGQINKLVDKQIKNKLGHFSREYAMEKIDPTKSLSKSNSNVNYENNRYLHQVTEYNLKDYYDAVDQRPSYSHDAYQNRKNLQPKNLTEGMAESMTDEQLIHLRGVLSSFTDNNALLKKQGTDVNKLVYDRASAQAAEANRDRQEQLIDAFMDSPMPQDDLPMTFKENVYDPTKANDSEEFMAWAKQYNKIASHHSYQQWFLDKYKENWLAAAESNWSSEDYEKVLEIVEQYADIDFFKLTATSSKMENKWVYIVSEDQEGIDEVIAELDLYKDY